MPHDLFGVIVLLLLSSLCVKKSDIEELKPHYATEFRTKHDHAVGICQYVI